MAKDSDASEDEDVYMDSGVLDRVIDEEIEDATETPDSDEKDEENSRTNVRKRTSRSATKSKDGDEENPKKTLACEVCSKSFTYRKSLINHKLKHSSSGDHPKDTEVSCPTCSKVLKNRSSLKTHIYYIHSEIGRAKRKIQINKSKGILQSSKMKKKLIATKMTKKTHSQTAKVSKGEENTSADQKKFNCSLCSASYSKRPSLNKHMRLHAKKGTYSCTTCRFRFNNIHGLKVHMAHKNHNSLKCKICGAFYTDGDLFAQHIAEHMASNDEEKTPVPKPVRSYRCTVCDETFPTTLKQRLHIKNHKVQGDRTCIYCGKVVGSYNSLRSHVFTHRKRLKAPPSEKQKIPERTIPCKQCPKLFSSITNLMMHKRCHASSGPLACPYCDSMLRNIPTWRAHIYNQHKENINPRKPNKLPSPRPENVSESKDDDKSTKTTSSKRFRCDKCPKTYDREKYLVAHIKSHEPRNLRTLVCPYCSKVYSSNLSFNTHTFRHRQALKKMNADGNENSKVQKSFKCDQCPKICVNAFNLKMHRAAHVRKKNLHPCPYDDCEKVLQTTAGLYHHIRRNHKANQKKQESSGSAAKLRKIGHTKEKEFTHRQDLKIRISLTGKSVKLSASSRQLKLKARITPNDVRKSLDAPSISLPEEEEADGDDQGQSDHLNEPEKTGIPCPKCGLCFQNERALSSHAWRHEPQKLRPSSAKDKEENAKPVQPKIAAVRGDVGIKNRVTKPSSNFTCDLCFKVYKTYRTLWSHKKSHRENNPIACPVCGNYYRNKICLRGHLKRHRKAMNMQIFPRWTPRCKKPEEQSENEEIDEVEEGSKESFSDVSEEKHEISKEKETTVETADVIKVFTCNHCTFSCESQKSLLNHIKCHTKKGTLSCKTCAMRFKTVKALKIHSWRHTAVKCHICSYQVSDEVRLAQHIEKMHNVEVKVEKDDDDIPVRRQMPERSATLREASRKQIAAVASTSTSNEAVYDCSYCNEKFSVEESFEKHMRRKHNIEPEISGIFYPSTSFGESSSEIPKTMQSSPEIPQKAPTPTMFQCDICSDKFNDKETRTRHIKEIHFGIKLT